jgi:sterol desaturase/sphingolipid hydroxylase (fatty acid hydroxylase superfamily)
MVAEYAELAGLACIPLFLVLDLVVRHRKFDAPRFWKLKGFVATVLTFALSMAIAIGWGNLVGEYTLLDLGGLGTVLGALVGILVYELIHYWYHRAIHKYDFAWRWAHQMHHSAESMDAFGAYWLHPIDTFFFTTFGSLVFFPLLGLAPAAGAVAGAFLVLNAMFQHANMRTPRWLGYVIQRPESHSVHHKAHRRNYSDLPLWDIVFGTFANPAEMERSAGFYKGASNRVLEMLVGRDVSEPRREKVAVGEPAELVPAS